MKQFNINKNIIINNKNVNIVINKISKIFK